MARKRVRVIFCENGCLQISALNLMPKVISKSLVLTLADGIEFTKAL